MGRGGERPHHLSVSSQQRGSVFRSAVYVSSSPVPSRTSGIRGSRVTGFFKVVSGSGARGVSEGRGTRQLKSRGTERRGLF